MSQSMRSRSAAAGLGIVALLFCGAAYWGGFINYDSATRELTIGTPASSTASRISGTYQVFPGCASDTTGMPIALCTDYARGTIAMKDTSGFSGVRPFIPSPLVPLRMIGLRLALPVAATTPLIGKFPTGITIQGIDCVTDPADAGESVVITVRQCDTAADNCAGVDGATTITCLSAGAADDGALSAPNITAGNWMDVLLGTVTGVVTQMDITIRYTEAQ